MRVTHAPLVRTASGSDATFKSMMSTLCWSHPATSALLRHDAIAFASQGSGKGKGSTPTQAPGAGSDCADPLGCDTGKDPDSEVTSSPTQDPLGTPAPTKASGRLCVDKTSYSVCHMLRSQCNSGNKNVQAACCRTCARTKQPSPSPTSPTTAGHSACADARVGPLAGLPCAKLKQYCTNAMFAAGMAKSCPATCGHCCTDKPSSGLEAYSCPQVKSMCTNPMFRASLRRTLPGLLAAKLAGVLRGGNSRYNTSTILLPGCDLASIMFFLVSRTPEQLVVLNRQFMPCGPQELP